MNGYISIRQVLDDILTHPLLRDLTLERAVNYCQEFMRIVGCPKLFNNKVEKVKIKDYRALLPCDFLKAIQVRGVHGEEFRYTTDSFHQNLKNKRGEELTYKIQGDVIYTSLKDGEIEIAYESIALDDDGFPLIPDNAAFIRALEFYIKKKWFTILFDTGQISAGVYQNAQQEYAFYVGQAQNELVKPSLDEMEAFTHMWNHLLANSTEHKNGFKNLGTREYIKVQ